VKCPCGENSKCLRTRCVETETIPLNSLGGRPLELLCGAPWKARRARVAPQRFGTGQAQEWPTMSHQPHTGARLVARWFWRGCVRLHLRAGRADRPRV
jgi:hypothetical protein